MEDYKKKYKSLVEAVKTLKEANPSDEGIQNWVKDNVPELKESEDEKIRKAIHIYFDWLDGRKDYQPKGEYTIRDMIAWLEKQGEQKQDPCEHCDDKRLNCHNFPCIKKKAFKQGKSALEAIIDEKVDNANKVEPFDKYEGLTDFERTLADICFAWISEEEPEWKQYIKDNANVLLRIAFNQFNLNQNTSFEHKSSWSEEDDRMLHTIIADFKGFSHNNASILESHFNECIDWLKTLKERVQPQLKRKWSEWDRSKIQRICKYLDEAKKYYADITEVRECIDWLKFLRPQYTWQPSDEQMEVLLSEVKGWTKGCHKQIVLESLYNDLKKLK